MLGVGLLLYLLESLLLKDMLGRYLLLRLSWNLLLLLLLLSLLLLVVLLECRKKLREKEVLDVFLWHVGRDQVLHSHDANDLVQVWLL